MEIHVALRQLVDRMGTSVLDDASNVRGLLDDVLDEGTATVGDLNLLVDAVRLGAIQHMVRVLDTGADPAAAVAMAGARLARDRGGADPQASSWACALWGFAIGLVGENVVRQLGRALRDGVAPVTLNPAIQRPVARLATTLPAAAPTLAPPAAPGRSARPRFALISVSLALLLAVLLGVGGAFVLTAERDLEAGHVDQPSSAQTADASSADASAEGSTADGVDAEIEPSGTNSGPQGAVECWDGTGVAGLGACSFPHGVQGLFWVFPGSDDDGCSDIARRLHGRVLDRYCAVALPGGGEAQFHYSQWPDFDRMRFNYRADQVGPDIDVNREDLHVFGVADADAEHKTVLFYRLPDAPWAVTVYTESARDMEIALGQLQIRPIKQLRGVGRQQKHLAASFDVLPVPAA